MPETPQLPIDDNTLFILLALDYQGRLEIDGLDSVYDSFVNYDMTRIKPNTSRMTVAEIANKGLEWVIDKFNIHSKKIEDNKIILSTVENEYLKIFLNQYLKKFNTHENYYHSEEMHKTQFCNFVKSDYECAKKFEKVFPYKISQNKQYKMIEYIGYLMRDGILSTNHYEPIFGFNNDGDYYRKVIQFKFTEEFNIDKFIKQGRKYQKGIFYTYETDANIYFKNMDDQQVVEIRKGLLTLVRKCIIENLDSITVKSFREVHQGKDLSDNKIRGYYDELNSALKNVTGELSHEFIKNQSRSGLWKIHFDLE